MFIGRDKELSALDRLYKSDKFSLIVNISRKEGEIL